MNGYHSYMNRVRVSPACHQRLMDTLEASGRTARPRPSHLSRYIAMAASFGFVLLASWGAIKISHAAPVPGGVALPPDTPPTAAFSPAPALDNSYTLVVPDPFQGQPHSNFNIPAIDYQDCTQSPILCGSVMLPKGHFTVPLTAAQMTDVLGGGAEALLWGGYALEGWVLYDGTGAVWQAVIAGEAGGTAFTLTLAPDTLPIADTIYEDTEEIDYNGIPITAYRTHHYGAGGGGVEHVYHLAFLTGGTGVRFQVSSSDQSTAATLADALASQAATPAGLFTVGGLVPESIPEWRSEALTLDEARAEDILGQYVPAWVPGSFSFEQGWRELGQNRDSLTLSWNHGYDYLQISLTRTDAPVEPGAMTRVHPTTGQWDVPAFWAEDLTPELIAEIARYVDDDAGDTPGYRYSFTVRYPDYVVAQYNLKGISPEDVAKMILG